MRTQEEVKEELKCWEEFVKRPLDTNTQLLAVVAIEQLEWVLYDRYPSQSARFINSYNGWKNLEEMKKVKR